MGDSVRVISKLSVVGPVLRDQHRFAPTALSEEASRCLNVANTFLSDKGVRGRILMCIVTGSTAYNLAHAKSDLDYVGTLPSPLLPPFLSLFYH